MIKHIVMFKLKDTDGKTALENAIESKRRFEKVVEGVPSLKKGECVINSQNAPDSNYTIALICDFDDINGLNEYQEHPVHKEFGAFIGTVKTERACIDYEF